VTTPRSPYEDTSVSVERSKSEISKALRDAGADGVQFEETWKEPGIVVRFAWNGLTCRFRAVPLPPVKNVRSGWRISPEQRDRQAWRGMAWYITSMVKAASFGLFTFEDIFMSFFEAPDGRTIGEALRPQLESGRLMLKAPEPSE
jgi:hypothetical protein